MHCENRGGVLSNYLRVENAKNGDIMLNGVNKNNTGEQTSCTVGKFLSQANKDLYFYIILLWWSRQPRDPVFGRFHNIVSH